MSLLKWVFIFVVIVAIGGGVYWLLGGFSSKKVIDVPLDTVATTTPTVVAPKPGIITSSVTDITDATLDADLKLVDDQLKGLTSDSKAIDTGINDKAIAQ